MKDKELNDELSKEKLEEYAKEAEKRWGNTELYKQSAKRYNPLSKEQKDRIQKESNDLTKEVASHIGEDVKSEIVQRLIEQHYNSLRNFYEPNLELYAGLANMYVVDERFKAHYEKFAKGLAQFMHDAMMAYCEIHQA